MKYSRNYALFLIIVILQALAILFWGTRKENLYWDEFYTLERAYYVSDSNPGDHYIDEDPDFRVGEWMPISFVKDTLKVSEKETLFNESPIKVIKKLTGSYNYSAYLNIAQSILSMGRFSIWPSIIFNTILFVLNQLVLFAMSRRLSDNETFPLAVCSMYGFSSMCLSMAVFIRFYMLATLLVSLFTYAHILYFENDEVRMKGHIQRILLLLLAFGALYLAHKNAQYTVIYGGIFVLVFAIVLWVKKGLKRFLYYILPMFGGGLFYLYTQTNYLQVILDPKSFYESSEGALTSTLDSVIDTNLSVIPSRLLDMAHIFGKYIFGSFFVMIAFIVIVLIVFAVHKMLKKTDEEKGNFSPILVVSSVAAIVYIALFAAFGLYEQVRYISFVFPELVVIVMAIAYKVFASSKYRYALVAALILLEVLSVNIKGKVDMLYTGDRESIGKVRDFGADSYILGTGNHITFMTYEAAIVAEDDDEFYVYNDCEDDALERLRDNLRDKMVVVAYYGVPVDDVYEMLREEGYQLDWIADTYNYVFFAAVRN